MYFDTHIFTDNSSMYLSSRAMGIYVCIDSQIFSDNSSMYMYLSSRALRIYMDVAADIFTDHSCVYLSFPATRLYFDIHAFSVHSSMYLS